MPRTTRSRTSRNVWPSRSISICLICLLTSVVPSGSEAHGDARAHGCRQRDRLDVVPLDPGRLDGADLLDEGVDVFFELVVGKTHLADAGVDVAALVGAVFDLAG